MPIFPLAPSPASATHKKLYYPIDIVATHEYASPNLLVQAIRFVAGAGPGFGTVDPDRYGMVMDPNQFAGVAAANDPSGKRRAAQAISANFQCASSVDGLVNDAQFPNDECVDFIDETGDPLTLPGIDPATVRRPRLRLKFSMGTGARLHGLLYISRQHSIEV